MRVEIRKTGEMSPVCETCGATELVHTADGPIAADLTAAIEREMVRREIGLARVLRDHLAVAAAQEAERETAMHRRLLSEKERLRADHEAALEELDRLLAAAKDGDIPGWRLARKRRERKFAERIDAVIAELADRTRFPDEARTDA